MNVYIYKADIYCELCGEQIINRISKPTYPEPYDTDDYPYLTVVSESDTPQHCGNCGIFLKNPLTHDGEQYVFDTIAMSENDPCVELWRKFYLRR